MPAGRAMSTNCCAGRSAAEMTPSEAAAHSAVRNAFTGRSRQILALAVEHVALGALEGRKLPGCGVSPSEPGQACGDGVARLVHPWRKRQRAVERRQRLGILPGVEEQTANVGKRLRVPRIEQQRRHQLVKRLVNGALTGIGERELPMQVHVVRVELHGVPERFDRTSEVPFYLREPSDAQIEQAAARQCACDRGFVLASRLADTVGFFVLLRARDARERRLADRCLAAERGQRVIVSRFGEMGECLGRGRSPDHRCRGKRIRNDVNGSERQRPRLFLSRQQPLVRCFHQGRGGRMGLRRQRSSGGPDTP